MINGMEIGKAIFLFCLIIAAAILFFWGNDGRDDNWPSGGGINMGGGHV